MADGQTSGSIRTLVAIATLCGLAGIAVTAAVRGDATYAAMLPVAAPLATAALGLAMRQWWGRWLGLAVGVTGALYGLVVLVTMIG